MIRQKIKAILMTGAIIFSLCACGQNTAKEETSVKLEKDGAVVNTIIEDFDETLYNVEDLKSMVLNEVAAFNSASGDKGISVEKLEVKDGKVTVAMTYANAEKYTEFNDKILFFSCCIFCFFRYTGRICTQVCNNTHGSLSFYFNTFIKLLCKTHCLLCRKIQHFACFLL